MKSVVTRASLGGALLLVALALGALPRVELARLAPPFLVANDSADYFAAAHTLATTGELHLSLKRTPLYSLFLAATIGGVGPSLDRILLVQHALGLVTIGLTYLLGRLAFGPLAGGLAAIGVALNGSLLIMEHLLVSEAVATPVLLAGLAALLAAIRRDRPPLWLLAGLLLGLGALARPLGIAVLGVALVGLVVSGRPRRSVLRGAGLLLPGATICLAPWVVRQATVHERAVVNGGLGDALYSRVRRYDQTFAFRDDGRPVPEADRPLRARIFELAPQYEYPREVRAVLRAEFGIDDRVADRLLRDVALTVIGQDPGRYVLGTLAMSARLARGSDPELPNLWESIQRDRVRQGWPAPLHWALATSRPPDDLDHYRRVAGLLALWRDDLPRGAPALALAPLGVAWALVAHRRTGAGVIPLVVASQLLLYVALDGPLFRYRFPLQPLIALLGAAGLVLVLRQLGAILRPTGEAAGDARPAGSPVARPLPEATAAPYPPETTSARAP